MVTLDETINHYKPQEHNNGNNTRGMIQFCFYALNTENGDEPTSLTLDKSMLGNPEL